MNLLSIENKMVKKANLLVWSFQLLLQTTAVLSLPFQSDSKGDEGCFWHLTDIHYDLNFTDSGVSKSRRFPEHSPSKKISPDVLLLAGHNESHFYRGGKYDYFQCWIMGGGKFGDYNCDSNEALIDSVLDFMNETSQGLGCNPFVIWTG